MLYFKIHRRKDCAKVSLPRKLSQLGACETLILVLVVKRNSLLLLGLSLDHARFADGESNRVATSLMVVRGIKERSGGGTWFGVWILREEGGGEDGKRSDGMELFRGLDLPTVLVDEENLQRAIDFSWIRIESTVAASDSFWPIQLAEAEGIISSLSRSCSQLRSFA